MRALVTGSNGFIGSALVAKLLQRGHQVRCLVRHTSNLRWLNGLEVEYHYGELLKPETLVEAVRDTDVIFHLAGVTRAMDRQGYFAGNYQATVNVLEASAGHEGTPPKFVFVSSQAAGGPSDGNTPRTEEMEPRPISAYGQSKLEAERAVLRAGEHRQVVIIRPPSVYGPRDRDVLLMFKNVKRGLLPVIRGGRQKVSMVHVHDLVSGILLAAEKSKADGKVFYVSGDEMLSWREIGAIMARAMNRNVRILPVPIWAVELFATFAAVLARIRKKPSLLNRDKVREMKQASWLCSNARAKRELGFQPQYDLFEGFKMTAAWYEQAGWL